MMRFSRLILLGLLTFLLVGFIAPVAWAGCSGYIGRATLNEASKKNNVGFVEVKLLDSNISSIIYNTWTIGVCSTQQIQGKDTLNCTTYNVSSASVTLPYLLVSDIAQKQLDFNKGADIILKDGSGNAIDYLSVGRYYAQESQASGCPFDFGTTVEASNTHTLSRLPDGTGEWSVSGPGGSVYNTGEATNDVTTGPDDGPIARVDIENVSVNRGDTATFTLSVYDEFGNPTTKPYSIQIEYRSIDDSAIAGTDYTAVSGTVTIPANAASATFDVPTLGSGGGCGGGGSALDFWVRILNPTGVAYPVVIRNHFAIGTINDGGTLDHIRIEHTGAGLTCQRSDIVIRACDDATCSSEYLCPVTVTMSPVSAASRSWLSGDTYTFSTGHTTVQLRQAIPETLALGITSPSPTPTNGIKCFKSGVEGDCNLAFHESGFIFDVPDLTSCQASAAVSIQAVRADVTAQTCVADGGFANSNKAVNFWSSYSNPASGSEQVSLSGTNISTASPGSGILLNFDATATANFTASYSDAGQLRLDARYDGVGAEEAGLVMLGNDSFIVRPVGFCVYSDDADSACVSGDASCTEFTKVDQDFNLKVKAVCWESSGDTDLCSGNSTTQNFILNNIPVTHNLVAPAAGIAGSIGVSTIDMVAADNGEHVIANQTVSEVGVFTFSATPPTYFGSALPVATSANIGRFTPDHFVTSIVSDGTLGNACTGFTYSGQSFGYDSSDYPEMLISAKRLLVPTQTTVNYRDDFAKLDDPTMVNMPAVAADSSNKQVDGTTPLALTWVPDPDLTANDDGTVTFKLKTDQFTYTRDLYAQVAGFVSDVQLLVNAVADSDGVAATDLPQSFAPSGVGIRYGQLALQNAYGPETLPLTLTFNTEYFNGTSFVINNQDSCTSYTLGSLSINDGEVDDLSAVETSAADIDPLNNTFLSGVGEDFQLAVPTTGDSGSVGLLYDLDMAGIDWLKPLDSLGAAQNLTGKATFGIYKGNERLIYMRESVQ